MDVYILMWDYNAGDEHARGHDYVIRGVYTTERAALDGTHYHRAEAVGGWVITEHRLVGFVGGR